MDKRDDFSSSLFFGLAKGVASFAQSEGGGPGSPEMSLLRELGVSELAQSVADSLRDPSSSQPREGLALTPAASSQAGQACSEHKRLIKEQARQRLTCFEGETKSSKARSATKRRSSCVSTTTSKTASGSAAFEASRMSESALKSQEETITRKTREEETGSE